MRRGDSMKKLMLAGAVALFAATPALAMKYFLQREWYDGANHMCQYGNGTVLNVGVKLCPLSIEG
tara:strand:- start:35 stop:229 length:195 start_codon:yes stop_codon:yes gene_type:complete